MFEHLLQYSIFAPWRNLLAFTTTRTAFRHNFPRFTGDLPEQYKHSRTALAEILNVNVDQLIFPRQSHTCNIEVTDFIPENELQDTDALMTNRPGICLCVQTADCVPVLLFDPDKNVISAIHAGWKGTVKKISAKAVRKMVETYGCIPENILGVIGPSIGPGVYEVGDEVVQQVMDQIPDYDKTLSQKTSGKYHLNLWEANRNLLLHSGLKSRNIEISGQCSYTEHTRFFSARRDGIHTGRMVSGIMLMT